MKPKTPTRFCHNTIDNSYTKDIIDVENSKPDIENYKNNNNDNKQGGGNAWGTLYSEQRQELHYLPALQCHAMQNKHFLIRV